MLSFELLKTANQKFTTNINNHVLSFSFHTANGLTYCDLSIDGEYAISGVKCPPNQSLFTPIINKTINGDFMFLCTTDDYPHYSSFDGIDVKLVYIQTGE